MTKTVFESEPHDGVALVTLRDEATKNSYSQPLMAGLTDAMNGISQNERYKVVVLTGYGNYFLTGGSKDELQRLQAGKLSIKKLTNMLNLLISCPIPIISAMQGHAIGAGFALGLHADLVVLAKESVYTANFVRYGFTPGQGATRSVPTKFGHALGYEMLYTGRNYRGAELAKRGAQMPILPRKEVLGHALDMAQQMAHAPRPTMVQLRRLLSADWRKNFDAHIEDEMSTMAETVQQAEVAENMAAIFSQ